MRTPCVLVITKDSVIGFALTHLINASQNGLVVIESIAQKFDELIKEINTYSADVILLENDCSFAGEASLTKLLMLYPRLLLIIVNEENNWLNIYRRCDLLMTSPADLVNAIYSG